ncbi:hypothetical protein [Phaeospirillum tilakii]|uniref:Uncharacterized protein n=1 Tax=Phaeospirillum tilakii TaxID=741673 RepID=A0ABW5CEQ6_9PROT
MAGTEMMAVGGSLYQGARAMTVRADLCRDSVPARLARSLGFPFASPDPGLPVILDSETWRRQPRRLGRELAEFIRYWMREPDSPGGHGCFDNLAVAGSAVWHFYDFTAGDGSRQASEEFVRLGAGLPTPHSLARIDLGRLILGINARFVLNPLNRPGRDAMTQLGWIAERRPRRLLVDPGDGNAPAGGDGSWLFGRPGGRDPADFSQIDTLAATLDALPREVETVYLNGLIPPVPGQGAAVAALDRVILARLAARLGRHRLVWIDLADLDATRPDLADRVAARVLAAMVESETPGCAPPPLEPARPSVPAVVSPAGEAAVATLLRQARR